MKWRGLTRARGVPSLLDRIVRDATIYFMMMFTTHLLLVLFELLAPVSSFQPDLFSPTSDKPHEDEDSATSCEVSRRSEYCDGDGFMVYYLISSVV